MGADLGSPTVARLLLAALLPSLLFIGHWQLPVSIPIPGTQYSLGGAGASLHTHGDHAGHCHSDSEHCSQAPVSPQAPAANLRELAVALQLATLATLAVTATWRPTPIAGVGPELRPPRILSIGAQAPLAIS